MASPRTLDALRSAVACVLTARGEAPDALRVTATKHPRGWQIIVSAMERSTYPLALIANGATEEGACAEAQRLLIEHLRADARTKRADAERITRALRDVVAAADRAEATLDAALTAARAVEAGG